MRVESSCNGINSLNAVFGSYFCFLFLILMRLTVRLVGFRFRMCVITVHVSSGGVQCALDRIRCGIQTQDASFHI